MTETAFDQQEAIFDAVLAELAVIGIDSFTVEGVARRAGVDAELIYRLWHDRRVLLMQTMLRRADEHMAVPDTGTLAGDLRACADVYADLSQREEHVRWLHRLLAAGGDVDLADVRADWWDVRFDAVAEMFRRAADRGELREGIDPVEAARMFVSACLCDVIVSGERIRSEYTEQMLDVIIRGITR